MKDLFNALSEFLKSDLAKGYGWVILVFFIICVCIVGFLIGVVFTKIIVPSKTVEAIEIKHENEKLLKQIEELEKDNASLKNKLNAQLVKGLMQTDPENDFEDKALKKFVK